MVISYESFALFLITAHFGYYLECLLIISGFIDLNNFELFRIVLAINIDNCFLGFSCSKEIFIMASKESSFITNEGSMKASVAKKIHLEA